MELSQKVAEPAAAMGNENLHYEYDALLRRTGTLPDPAASAIGHGLS